MFCPITERVYKSIFIRCVIWLIPERSLLVANEARIRLDSRGLSTVEFVAVMTKPNVNLFYRAKIDV